MPKILDNVLANTPEQLPKSYYGRAVTKEKFSPRRTTRNGNMFILNKTSSNRKKLDQFSFFDFSLQKNGRVCEVARRMSFRLSFCLEFRGRFFCILCSQKVRFLVGFSFLFCLLCRPLPISSSVKRLLFRMFYILPCNRLHDYDNGVDV
jgi:hypothetical protein